MINLNHAKEAGELLSEMSLESITRAVIDTLTMDDFLSLIKSGIKGGYVQKMEVLELIGEKFARKYWGFEEVEDE